MPIQKKDAHPIHLELVDSHTYLQTNFTEQLSKMDHTASLQNAKQAKNKLDKILEGARVEGENMVTQILLETKIETLTVIRSLCWGL